MLDACDAAARVALGVELEHRRDVGGPWGHVAFGGRTLARWHRNQFTIVLGSIPTALGAMRGAPLISVARYGEVVEVEIDIDHLYASQRDLIAAWMVEEVREILVGTQSAG